MDGKYSEVLVRLLKLIDSSARDGWGRTARIAILVVACAAAVALVLMASR
jgi:hypothetical protein